MIKDGFVAFLCGCIMSIPMGLVLLALWGVMELICYLNGCPEFNGAW